MNIIEKLGKKYNEILIQATLGLPKVEIKDAKKNG
jgi:hypothetical protein